MDWLINLFTTTDSVAHIVLLYAIVIAVGVYLGKIKIGGISIGVTFVTFCRYCRRTYWLYRTNKHSIISPRVRTDTLCVHDRTSGRSWFSGELQKRRNNP